MPIIGVLMKPIWLFPKKLRDHALVYLDRPAHTSQCSQQKAWYYVVECATLRGSKAFQHLLPVHGHRKESTAAWKPQTGCSGHA